MKAERALLSWRYRDDGRAAVRQGGESRRAVRELRGEIRDGTLRLAGREACPVCGAEEGRLIAEKDRLGIPSRVVLCAGCGLGINDSFFAGEAGRRLYEQYWIRIQGYTDREAEFRKRVAPGAYAWARFAYVTSTLEDGTAGLGRVAEVGARDGANLLPYRLTGAEAYGCDLDPQGFAPGREAGIHLVEGSTRALRDRLPGPADLVVLSHLLEHLEDPEAELRQVAASLEPGGYLYVEVPGLLGLLRPRSEGREDGPYRSGNDVLMYLQAAHTLHLALAHVTALARRAGFRRVRGDEWVRALFRLEEPGEDSGLPGEVDPRSGEPMDGLPTGRDVLRHLRRVERDFLSPVNQAARVFRYLGRRLG